MTSLNKTFALYFLSICLLYSCSTDTDSKLSFIGEVQIEGTDTIYHKVPDFLFIDQDSNYISNESFQNKAYVVDFFFTSCPTICPMVKKQMLRIYERYENEDGLKFLSHSIDTRRDSVPHLKRYATNLGISSTRWHLVTGEKSKIYDIADDYFSVAKEDPSAPGGYDHSGRLILVDPNGHIRAFCDGTNPKEVDLFMEDIDKLLKEMNEQ